MAPYIAKVEAHLKSILDPVFSATFHTPAPPATTTHAITEYRIGRNLIKDAVEAERQGYAAMAITHFQDAGLAEVKSVVDIPVLGLGETTLFHACTLGRKLGLVTINPVFIPWHEDQIIRYGLQNRVVGVRAVEATVADFIQSFAAEEAKRELAPKWERDAGGRYRHERREVRGQRAEPRRGCQEDLRRQRLARLARRGGRAHAHRHLCAACRGRGEREPGGGAGRRHLEPELLPQRPVLPQQGRPVSRFLSRGAAAVRGTLPRRLRLSPRAHRLDPHSRDPGT